MLVEHRIILKGLFQGGLLGILSPLCHHAHAELLQRINQAFFRFVGVHAVSNFLLEAAHNGLDLVAQDRVLAQGPQQFLFFSIWIQRFLIRCSKVQVKN